MNLTCAWSTNQEFTCELLREARLQSNMSLVRASAILTEFFTFLESKKHPGICDTQVLEIQFIPQNVLFLRWHYPDQVLGFKVNTLRLSRFNYQHPIQLLMLVYYAKLGTSSNLFLRK